MSIIDKLISTHIELYYYKVGDEDPAFIVELPFSKELLTYVYSFPELVDRDGCQVSEERLTKMSCLSKTDTVLPKAGEECHVVISGMYDWN